MSDDTWIEVESDASDADPEIVAKLFESIAETLRRAPDGKKYTFDLTLEEQ